MSEALGLMAALDKLVLEKQEDGFVLREDPPEWFVRLGFGEGERTGPLRIELLMPFLEVFLPEAEKVWRGDGAGRVDSDCWTETARDGEELHFEATALRLPGSSLLIITRNEALFQERRRVLQKARELRAAYDAFARELERKDVLIHCIVHDLTTPLNSMLGSLSLLEEEAPSAGRSKELIHIAANAALHQRELIRDILDTFAAERSELVAPFDDFGVTPDLWDAVAVARETLLPIALNRGVALDSAVKDPARPPCKVIGEPRRLARVLVNLLDNAIRFTPPGKSVHLFVDEEATRARVRVEDEGPGVSPDVAPHLFHELSRGRDPGAGTGLGLYFCRITVVGWGGAIGYEPRAEGGARFWFQLRRAGSVADREGERSRTRRESSDGEAPDRGR